MLSYCLSPFVFPKGFRLRTKLTASRKDLSVNENGFAQAPAIKNSEKMNIVGTGFSVRTAKGREGSSLSLQSSTSAPILNALRSRLGNRRLSPELGLLSIFFVLSMALGSILWLAIISVPTVNAFRNLAISMHELTKVVYDEVPGTLSSLKLSALEINELTHQLITLREFSEVSVEGVEETAILFLGLLKTKRGVGGRDGDSISRAHEN